MNRVAGRQALGALELDEPRRGNYFVSTYPPFSRWTATAVSSYRQRLEQPPPSAVEAPLGLYVHVPFCVKRCAYCYYLSYTGKTRDHIDAYLDALLAELALYARAPGLAGRRLRVVYFGGGTPSLLSAAQIGRLLSGLKACFPWRDVREVTFECAPQTVTAEKVLELREAGVTRLSLGVQQLDDDVLAASGRVHQVRDVERAYAAIRSVGFRTVNLDLMAGMVGETDESFHQSLNRVIHMGPDSVTIYQLEIPHNTPLFMALDSGALTAVVPTWEVKRARLARGFAALEQAGYTLRSAYTAVRSLRVHEFVYQDDQYRGADFLGIGVSAFSYLDGVHHQNLAALEPYLERIRTGVLPYGRAYALSDAERLVREFILQLKLGEVSVGALREKYGVDVLQHFAKPLERFAARGWLEMGAAAVTLTRAGLLRVDRMIPFFYLSKHQQVRYS